MSKVLVTGGAGFIGSHVVDALILQDHEVTIIDNLSTGKMDNLHPWATFINGDITDPNLWRLINDDYDYVYHLAALARIQPSIDDPVNSNDVNLVGTLRVLEYCRKHDAKIIFSGSSSVYKGDVLPTSELDPKDPQSPYAMQKLMSEQYIRLFAKLYGVKYVVLRYFNVYGERQLLGGAYAAVIGIFLDQKSLGDPLTITNDGEQRRDFTYVGDVARANLYAMNWQGTFNIGSSVNYSMNQIADLISKDKLYIGDRPGEVRETLADNTKAKWFGWTPTTDVSEWISGQL